MRESHRPPPPRLPLIAAAVAGALLCGGSLAYIYKRMFPPPPPPLVLEHRIERLTEYLRSAASSIAAIEQEIALRKQLVDQLKADAATAEQLKTVNREQANAIAQTLQGQLRQRDDDTWRAELVGNIMLTVFGAVIGQFPWFIAWWRRRNRGY